MLFKRQMEAYQPHTEEQLENKNVILSYVNKLGEEVLHRSSSIAHMTSSAVILNETFDKMLMIHHNIYKTWTWTGGHSDGDDDLKYVALKEAKEETGLSTLQFLTEEIIRLDVLPVYGHYKNGVYVSTHLHLNASFVLIADEKDTICMKADENSGVQWVAVEDIALYANEPEFVALYLNIIQYAKNMQR